LGGTKGMYRIRAVIRKNSVEPESIHVL